MAEFFLVRHTESFANLRDFTAFGNFDSPLTPRGRIQARAVGEQFRDVHHINPAEYACAVASSQFKRARQTAHLAGFRHLHLLDLINESDVDREIGTGENVIARHREEQWAPEETHKRVAAHLDAMQSGEYPYKISFTHGMYIGDFMWECVDRGIEVPYAFDAEKYGYIPLRGTVIKIDIPTR